MFIMDGDALGDVVCGRIWVLRRSGPGARPENDRLGDAMTGTLGYARVSTGDQDVAGQTMRLTGAGAIRVFTDVRSGRNMDRPGLQDLLAYARPWRHAGRRAPGPPGAVAGRVADDRDDAEGARHRAAQPGGKDRHVLGGPAS